MKLLLLSLCLATTASGDFLVPAWTAKEENVIQTLTTKHTPDLRKSCVMVGRLGLSEIRTAVFITENGDLLAPYLEPIDGDDEAPYLLYLPDGSRRLVDVIEEKKERGIALLKTPLPEGHRAAPLAPDQSIISAHWFLYPVTAPISKLSEPIAFAIDHLFPRPEPEAVSFVLESGMTNAGTPIFDLAGRLVAMTGPTDKETGRALLISRLAEDSEKLREILPERVSADLPRLPLSPALEEKEDDKEDKKKEAPSSPLSEARETFAQSLMPGAAPFAIIFNEGKAVTHSISAVIIRSNGFLLTKASELGPDLNVRYAGKTYPAALLATDEASDLALVGINATNLPVIQWASPETLTAGTSLITPILLQETSDEMVVSDSMAFGTFSHQLNGNSPTLHAASQVTSLGIVTEQSASEVRVASIDPDSPAAKTDLKNGDLITALDDKPVTDRASLTRLLSQKRVGNEVTLKIKNGEEETSISLALTRPRLTPPPTGISMTANDLAMVPSVRRFGFEKAIVHTLPLNAWDCGSPLYNLDGQAIGLNISASSANRTLALPPSVIQAAIQRMLQSSNPF
tara:strand:+ start:6638 stop:8353 length:1716 start_codon:yes stop_codon:yes gene_type:complete